MSKPTTSVRERDVLAKFFRGLGDPSRLSILLLLRSGPRRVSEIVAATGLSQPNASMHLACLWECGLVEREPAGSSVYYRLASPRVTPLLELAESLLAANGHRIECCPRYRKGATGNAPNGRPRRALARGARPSDGRPRRRSPTADIR